MLAAIHRTHTSTHRIPNQLSHFARRMPPHPSLRPRVPIQCRMSQTSPLCLNRITSRYLAWEIHHCVTMNSNARRKRCNLRSLAAHATAAVGLGVEVVLEHDGGGDGIDLLAAFFAPHTAVNQRALGDGRGQALVPVVERQIEVGG